MLLWYVEDFGKVRLCSFTQVLVEWVRLPSALPWHALALFTLLSVVPRKGLSCRKDSHS